MLSIFTQILDNFNFNIDEELSREENSDIVIKNAALLSGAISVEPLPFADVLLITPLQIKMVLHIGKIYGFEISNQRAKSIIKELGATIAYGMFAREIMRGVAKIALPAIGGLITSPLVYAWTFILGRLAEKYFQNKILGKRFGDREKRLIFKQANLEAKKALPSTQDFTNFAEELKNKTKNTDLDT